MKKKLFVFLLLLLCVGCGGLSSGGGNVYTVKKVERLGESKTMAVVFFEEFLSPNLYVDIKTAPTVGDKICILWDRVECEDETQENTK